MANDKKEEKAAKPEATPEEQAASSRKRRLLLFVIGGVVLAGGIGAALAIVLGGGSKMAAKPNPESEHGEAKEAEHGEAKEAEHGEAKSEHGEAKGEHGEKKEEAKEGHGEKKEEGHGGGEHGEKKEGGKKDEGTKVAVLEGVDFGCTTTLQPFHLNLGNPLENRYIRLEVAVEYGCNDDTKAEIDKRLPQLRDAIIAVTSRKTREFLLGPDGKEQLRKEVHNRLNHYMTRKIDDVFITDILIE